MKHLVAIIVVLAAILSGQAQPRQDRKHPMPGTVGVTVKYRPRIQRQRMRVLEQWPRPSG